MRLRILERDRYRCHWCGQPANTVDHLKPRCEGGARYDPRNLVAACHRCNTSRGGRLGRQHQLANRPPTKPGPRHVWPGAITLDR